MMQQPQDNAAHRRHGSKESLRMPASPRRKRNLYDPNQSCDYRLSRSKIDLYMSCARCFYLDRRLGISAPPSYPLTLATAVDELMKNEFDIYRSKREPHPLMANAGIDAVPYEHRDLDAWRDSLRRGITYSVPNTPLIITGGIDDIWQNKDGKLHIVDYKSTAKQGEVSIDADWQIGYKRQLEIYQWLFRKNGFDVSDTAYFVYVNGDKNRPRFDNQINFSSVIIPYDGDSSWVDGTITNLLQTLNSSELPESDGSCKHCSYRMQAASVENWKL
jgi:CRISPR/Cas system-associated exonuclease Cas4 (RecB family)